eukprot:TRINITY_DN342_c0_g1_i4.p1 TRINITY_DN342_c0_g1~~TRINITY_DN342_c0_g1_i4.p1  ORF type:complete len:192 (+),score=46.42 TRINITY_DN342_c0_g1_i4:3-578(+)
MRDVIDRLDFFFFFKQKTAYEIMPSLVGSEMCIRDRYMGNINKRKQFRRNSMQVKFFLLAVFLLFASFAHAEQSTERTNSVIEGFLATLVPPAPHDPYHTLTESDRFYDYENCGGRCPGNCIAYIGCKIDPRDPRKTHQRNTTLHPSHPPLYRYLNTLLNPCVMHKYIRACPSSVGLYELLPRSASEVLNQ